MLRYLTQDSSIECGDIVITSGLGGNLPKRLVIGQVVKVVWSEAAMFQEATLVPAVTASDLERVLILLNFVPIDAESGVSATEE